MPASEKPEPRKIIFHELPVIVEWPKNSVREGVRPDGSRFQTEMQADYGYIPHTQSEDEEKTDVYLGDDEASPYAYIVEQLDEEGNFDEHKVILGVDSLPAAEELYLAHVPEHLLGEISEVAFDQLLSAVSAAKQHHKLGAEHSLIEAFVHNYKHEIDYFNEVAGLAQDKLDQALQDAGIKAVVSSRAKRPHRLEKKLYKRDPQKHYQSFRDIYEDIIDLAGVRVALYLPAEQGHVKDIIEQLFQLMRQPKHFPKDRDPDDALGYVATHYLVHLKPESLRSKELRYADTPIEIQVMSVLMSSWSEVAHDLTYKQEKGELTDYEKKILLDINRLVQVGEKQLEKLQAAIENRTSQELHFEIAAALGSSLKERSQGKTAGLTLEDVKLAAELLGETIQAGSPKKRVSTILNPDPYIRSQQILAHWIRADQDDDRLKQLFEQAGHKTPNPATVGDTHYLYRAMDELAPGRPYNTYVILPLELRSQILQRAQALKEQANQKKSD